MEGRSKIILVKRQGFGANEILKEKEVVNREE